MEAPEKLYIQELQKPIMIVRTEKAHDSDIEYTRTDVFIEKAKKYIANHFLVPGMCTEIDNFVNYMKGD